MTDKDEVLENEIEDTHVDDLAALTDSHDEWYSAGYVTAMDEMNALEADDYRHEFDDIDF